MFERFALTSSVDDSAAALAADTTRATGWRASYRFGVGDRILIVRQGGSHETPRTELVVAKWGYLPSWTRGELKPVASVGIERLSQNGVFRTAVEQSRCLIPMNGYFDWEPRAEGKDVPIFVQGPQPIVAAMGLFSAKRVGARAEVSVAFVTRDEVASGAPTRTVPAVLHRSDWSSWLDLRRTSVEEFAEPSPLTRSLIQSLRSHQVSDRIASATPRNSASITAPIFADAGCR